MRTYKTEDGHIKANCPICEGSEHIDYLQEYKKCQLCELEGRPHFKRVFQMSFDIAEGENIPTGEIESLFNALEEHINNFYDINGNRLKFQSVGGFNCEDMSHAYGEVELNKLNENNK